MTVKHPALAALAAAALLLSAFQSTPAAAQPGQVPCGDLDRVVAKLRDTYGEVPVAAGLSAAGHVVEVLASPAGSFTILAVLPDGLACLMSAGEGWGAIDPEPEGPGT